MENVIYTVGVLLKSYYSQPHIQSVIHPLPAALHNAFPKSKENLTVLCLKYLNCLHELRVPPPPQGGASQIWKFLLHTHWREECMDAWKAPGSECIRFFNVIAPE